MSARSDSIAQLVFADLARAMCAAENLAGRFHAVPDNFASAMRAFRRKDLDRALKAVEDVLLPLGHDLEGFIVVVSAELTFRHNFFSNN